MVLIIVFRDGMFGKDGNKLKGHESGLVGTLWKMLKRRKRREETLRLQRSMNIIALNYVYHPTFCT